MCIGLAPSYPSQQALSSMPIVAPQRSGVQSCVTCAPDGMRRSELLITMEGNNCGPQGVRQQLAVYHVYHNFVLPHASLRQPLPIPEAPNGTGAAKQWRLQTPALAAGLTDRVWSLREVLMFRVPP